MLSDKDIERLIEVFATKNEVRSIVQGELAGTKDTQKDILKALDRIATAVDTMNFGNAATDAKLSRHDRWIHELADNAQVKLII